MRTISILAAMTVGLLSATGTSYAQNITARSKTVQEKVLIDNNDVKVTRVIIPPGATQVPNETRSKRVIVWLTPNHTERHAKKEDSSNENKPEDKGEELSHQAGDAVFRMPSKHSITNRGKEDEVSLIIELKH